MGNRFWTIVTLALITLVSCDSSTIYDESENATWSETDTLYAKFEVKDTTRYHSVFLNSRFSSEYKFSNIYFKVILDGPGNQRIERVRGFEVTDKAGKWLGSGFGSLYGYAFPIFEDLSLKQNGKYKVRIVPYMRIPDLNGIHDRGVKVSLGQEIF